MYLSLRHPIACIAGSAHWLALVESISRQPVGLEEKEELTIKAYGLQEYSLVGVSYRGESVLHFATTSQETDPTRYLFQAIRIKRAINKIKMFSNVAGMGTGESTVLIAFLP
jgi:hypothetical protein